MLLVVVVVVVFIAYPRKEGKRKDENSRNDTGHFASNLFDPKISGKVLHQEEELEKR